MVSNQDNIESDEYNNLSYKDLLEIVRSRAKITAKDFIPKLYEKLLKERKKPEEAKIIIEHDLSDIWAKSYIREFIPEESKDGQKVESGKKGQKKKQELAISVTGDVIHDESRAKLSQAEQAPISQTKPTSASDIIPQKVTSDENIIFPSIQTIESIQTIDDEPKTKNYRLTLYFAGKNVSVIIIGDIEKIITENKYTQYKIVEV